MCLVPDIPKPDLPPETQQMRQPDGEAVRSAVSRRTNDKISSASKTILTSGSGVGTAAPTAQKTLLGQ